MATETPATPAEREQRNERDAPEAGRVVPKQPDPPPRHRQDTEAVSGEAATNPPRETEIGPGNRVQG